MRKLMIATMMALTTTAVAQVTLENTYSGNWRMSLEKVEGDGYKYIGVEAATKKVIMYNADHSVWKTVNTSIPASANMYTLPFYTSRTLFNSDNKVEFLIIYLDGSTFTAQLYNEDGNVLNTFSNCAWYEVKKGDNGWKLLVHSNGSPQYTSVYSLPGQYAGLQKPGKGDNGADTELYPNPMGEAATLRYSLPVGEHSGVIDVYSVSGVKIRSYDVTDQYSNIIIHRNDLPGGTYYYTLTTANGTAPAEKFVIL